MIERDDMSASSELFNGSKLFKAMLGNNSWAVRQCLAELDGSGVDERTPYHPEIIWDQPFRTPLEHLEFLPGNTNRLRDLFEALEKQRRDDYYRLFLNRLENGRLDPVSYEGSGGVDSHPKVIWDAVTAVLLNDYTRLVKPLFELIPGIDTFDGEFRRILYYEEHLETLVEFEKCGWKVEEHLTGEALDNFQLFKVEQLNKQLDVTTPAAPIKKKSGPCPRCGGPAHPGPCRRL